MGITVYHKTARHFLWGQNVNGTLCASRCRHLSLLKLTTTIYGNTLVISTLNTKERQTRRYFAQQTAKTENGSRNRILKETVSGAMGRLPTTVRVSKFNDLSHVMFPLFLHLRVGRRDSFLMYWKLLRLNHLSSRGHSYNMLFQA